LRRLLRAWAVQKRVLGALFMREIQVRWGRRNLGFAWLFAEPLVFAFPVIFMWSQIRAPVEHGFPMIGMVWSGYLPLLVFRHVTGTSIYVVRTNAGILYHSAVTPVDIIFGHCGLEVLGNLAAVACSFFIFYAFDLIEWPANPLLVIVGNLYMAWWAFVIATIVASASERSNLVEHIWAPISYIYMPLSGFFYLAEWLPTPIRSLALAVMPSVHCYEMIRSGLWGARFQAYYDLGYLTFILAVLTVLGLWLARDTRRYIELE
jgi:capsular polysaccharide transport system permease protein